MIFSLRRSASVRMPAARSLDSASVALSLHDALPIWQLAREMFDQDADEALVRTEDRAVEHHRAVLLAILADIGGVESLGQHAVGLKRAHLPGAADRVGEVAAALDRGDLLTALVP